MANGFMIFKLLRCHLFKNHLKSSDGGIICNTYKVAQKVGSTYSTIFKVESSVILSK